MVRSGVVWLLVGLLVLAGLLSQGVALAAVRGAPPVWNAYETSVLPGSGIQIATPRVGFSLLGEPTNGIDDNLASPAGLVLAWPSPRVLVTRNGGSSWKDSLSAPGGFWGLDVLGADRVWAVGVTGLYRSVDAGERWQRAGEPQKVEPSNTLVRVSFSSATSGFGLTVKGRLVQSGDAGSSWRASTWSGQGEAVCASKSGVVIVADQAGAVWRSANGGRSWRQVAPALARLASFSSWYSDLSCQGDSAVEFSQAFCGALVSVCGTEVVSRVRQTTNGARTWGLILEQDAAEPGAGGVHTQPSSALTVPLSRAAAAAGRLCVFGYTFWAPASAQITCATQTENTFQAATIPRLPLPAARSYVALQGFDFLNAKVGWVLLDEYSSSTTGAPSGSEAKTVVWATYDGGTNWRAKYVSATYRGRWCTKVHTSTCWR